MFWATVLARFTILLALFGALLFGSAGRLNIPAFWAWLSVMVFALPVMSMAAGSELMRERMNPPKGGKDQLIRVLAIPIAFGHLGIAGLDVGRFHWSDNVAIPLQIWSFMALVVCLAGWAVAMRENKFFSSVIRIQRERGHRVIDTGPYGFVRHPGYAAAITATIWSGLALGSWLAVVPAVPIGVLFIRRILLEDRTLHEQLEGYKEYAQRVRYRIIPGVW
jgi:protein-S-isoprenylcysteine O-methyltransferase Ste14